MTSGDTLPENMPQNIIFYEILSKLDETETLTMHFSLKCVSRTLQSTVNTYLFSSSSLDLPAFSMDSHTVNGITRRCGNIKKIKLDCLRLDELFIRPTTTFCGEDSDDFPNTTTNLPQDDINSPHHPLYFHPNDHPGLLLIAKKLNGFDNYETWKRSMLIALSAKNKLKLINGEYDEPVVDSPLKAYWERANDMLISWILNNVSQQIGNHLTFVNSAFTLWSELQEHYSQLDGHRIHQLANEIVELKQSNCTIEVYYHKLKGLWDEIDAIEAPYACTCKRNCENRKENGEREQRKRLIQFLMGLDECYTNIRGQILLMQPLPLVAKAYYMLRQEEKQRDFPKHSSQTPVTLNTYRNAYTPSYRNNHPNTPNNPTNGPQTERRNTFRKGIFCGYYKKEGHSKEECYKLLGYHPGHPLHKKYQPPSQRAPQVNRGQRSMNMMTGDTLPPMDTPLHPMNLPN
ncbi:cysteine-rich receptor-like protein kinase 8 [Tanacetum coccineum]